MRIESPMALTGVCGVAGIVGGLGAYVIKPIVSSMSPAGVALTCMMTTAISCAVHFSDLNSKGQFVGFLAAYPIWWLSANRLICRVHFLDPIIAWCVGAACLAPIAITAFFLTFISTSFRQAPSGLSH